MHALFGVSNVDGCGTSGFDRFPVGYDHKYLAVAGIVGGWQVLEVAIKRTNDLSIYCYINGDTITYSDTDTNSFFVLDW